MILSALVPYKGICRLALLLEQPPKVAGNTLACNWAYLNRTGLASIKLSKGSSAPGLEQDSPNFNGSYPWGEKAGDYYGYEGHQLDMISWQLTEAACGRDPVTVVAKNEGENVWSVEIRCPQAATEAEIVHLLTFMQAFNPEEDATDADVADAQVLAEQVLAFAGTSACDERASYYAWASFLNRV